MNSVLKCPKCGTDLTDAMQEEVRKEIRAEFGDKYRTEKKKLEEDYLQKQRSFDEEMRKVHAHYEQEQKKRNEELRSIAEKKAYEQFEQLLKAREQELQEKNIKLQEINEKELLFLKKQREWQEEKDRLHIDIEKKLMDERNAMQEKIYAQAQEQVRIREEQTKLKDAEKDKKIEDMQKLIEDLQRKSQQGSQQLQGEVAEIELSNILSSNFRFDIIADVPKGVRGADIIQTVNTQFGVECGKIIWESKRTKAWSNEWVDKLKEDMRSVKASVAIIVSSVLPKGIDRIGYVDGVWVSDFPSAIGLAMALRQGLLDVARTKSANEGKNEKMEMVYAYLSGEEFRQKIQAIAETFSSMRTELDKEKIAMHKLWAQREKSIERIMINTTGMFGDIHGIIGGALQTVPLLELESGEE
ncbi:MAG TPA: DUF2130 domain-containing protein [Candidatus Kapabacteria bacterium]|jgi:hypothetical protein|nr:DUF2130 domain-containing protein [Candidatus Kapabacteria bacterium]HRE58860.1 DUF2130 domain-containing protein [Candidatus Kapabacteria bacterium]